MDLDPWVGHIISHSYTPGFIVLSYLTSLSGCWTALDLLDRRTSSRGLYNWYLLLAAAIAMGAVGVWCMHFIGNLAVLMDKGQPELQIQYSPGCTVGSFFLPIVGVGMAFYLFGTSENVTVLGTSIGGLITGAAICGMHYMSQIGLANYAASYARGYVVGSAVIAVFASTVALGTFFYLTANWKDSWVKRGSCAALMAASVSGMHWLATVGCRYHLKSSKINRTSGLSREATVIVVICLSFEDVFDIDHPVFCWIYRVSHCWKCVAPLIPVMRMHLRSMRRDDVYDHVDYPTLFKEQFCVAASNLAMQIQEPFEDIGVIFGEIMTTGTLRKRKFLDKAWIKRKNPDLLERKQQMIRGHGQLLFVFRHVDLQTSFRLQSTGHRFTSLANVVDLLARSVELTPEELLPQLERMRDCPENARFLNPGVHLACFALRPVPQRGFDILVRKNASFLLPTVQLNDANLAQWELEVLEHMDNWTLATCREHLHSRFLMGSQDEQFFVRKLYECICKLAHLIDRPCFESAKLYARPLRVTSRNKEKHDSFMVAFRYMADAHIVRSINGVFEFTSSKFFLVQQHAYHDSPDNEIFSRQVHHEFAALLEEYKDYDTTGALAHQSWHQRFDHPLDTSGYRPRSTVPAEVDHWSPLKTSFTRPNIPVDDPCLQECDQSFVLSNSELCHGGIHVSQEIHVDISKGGCGQSTSGTELRSMGVFTEASVGNIERKSFADELMLLTTQERKRQRSGLTV